MKDRDAENIFDTSTSLLEIEEPSTDDGDSGFRPEPPPDMGGEPDYFTPNPAIGQTDARRRALGVLGLVGGGIFTAILISAATGSGNDQAGSPAPRADGDRSEPARTATIVAPQRTPQPGARKQGERRPGADREQVRPTAPRKARPSPSARRKQRRRRARRNHPPAPAATPAPETTYTPEPEQAYVPTEVEAPPPSPPSPPPSSSSGGASQEFGIEP